MQNFHQKIEIINELEKLCNSLEWFIPTDSKEDPLDYGVHNKGESIKTWHVPKNTGQFLFFLVCVLQPKKILELGTSVGYSSLWLGSAAEQYGGHVDTIEYFEQKIKIAQTYIQKTQLQNTVTVHRQKIIDFLDKTTTCYQFVFMDADKGNYKKYFEILKEKASKNCLIIVDNAGNFNHHMVELIDVCKNDPSVATSFLPLDNGLFFIQLGRKHANLLNIFNIFESYK